MTTVTEDPTSPHRLESPHGETFEAPPGARAPANGYFPPSDPGAIFQVERGGPLALYRTYCWYRRQGDEPGPALAQVERVNRIPPSQFAKLAERVLALEREHGLLTERAWAELVQSQRPAPPAAPDPPADPLGGIERDARQRVTELEDARRRLAPEALTDGDVARELSQIEDELAAAERALERVPAARRELTRRDAEARSAERQQQRANVLAEIAESDVQRRKLASTIDAAFAKAAKALSAYQAVCGRQVTILNAIGEVELASPRRYRDQRVEAALRHALLEAKVRAGESLGLRLARDKPLIDGEPVETVKE